MKIVLKYDNQLKLFTQELNFTNLWTFVQTEFKLLNPSIQLTFQDDDGDNISLRSNEDLEILQSIFEGKEYVKVTVQGKRVINASNIIPTHCEPKVARQTVQECPVAEQVKGDVPLFEERKSRERVSWNGHCQSGSKDRGCHRRQKFERLTAFMNETVSKLVDQRIKVLLPIIKHQILNEGKEEVGVVSDVIHTGFQCKGCSITPIAGIRYQCTKCLNFSLCEKCQASIPHQHNLLKIRIVEQKKSKDESPHHFGENFGREFRFHGHHRRRESSSSSKEKGHKWRGHRFMKKIWGLSFLFGGEPNNYIEFVEKTGDLKPRETYQIYAKQVAKLSDEEFKTRFVNLRCQKLSRNFGRPTEYYKTFVEANFDLGQKEMMYALFESGLESRDNKRQCGGRRYNFNDVCGEKKECSRRGGDWARKGEGRERCQRKWSKNHKVQQVEISSPLPQEVLPVVNEAKPMDTPLVAKAKGGILLKMSSIFGEEIKVECVNLIDKYYSKMDQQDLINLLTDQFCKK